MNVNHLLAQSSTSLAQRRLLQRWSQRLIPRVSPEPSGFSGDVAHVARRFTRKSWGGMETRVLELCKQQAAHTDIDPAILTANIYEDVGSASIDAIPLHRFGYQYPVLGLGAAQRQAMDQVGGNLVSWGLFAALMRAPKLKLIHAHCTKRLGGMAWLASRLRGVPFVVSLHGDVLTLPSHQEERFRDNAASGWEWGKAVGMICQSRRLLEVADAVIAVGYQEYEALQQKLGPERVHFVPGGVDYDRFSKGRGERFRAEMKLPQDAPMLLQVGRIDPQKNQSFSLDLLQSLHQMEHKAHLVCVGAVTDPAYLQKLQQKTASYGLEKYVHFLQFDYKSQLLVDAFHAAQLLLQPSLHEPFGLTVVEGWCAAKPVIAADIGGLKRLVQHGVGGFSLSTSRLSEWSFRAAWLLKNEDRARDLGQQGQAEVKRRYLWRHTSARVASIYQQLQEGTPS